MTLVCLKETDKAPPQSSAERNGLVPCGKDRREEQRQMLRPFIQPLLCWMSPCTQSSLS